jgi:hypothetical protein
MEVKYRIAQEPRLEQAEIFYVGGRSIVLAWQRNLQKINFSRKRRKKK